MQEKGCSGYVAHAMDAVKQRTRIAEGVKAFKSLVVVVRYLECDTARVPQISLKVPRC